VIELLYFALLCVVFLVTYGIAAQCLLYPHSEENGWNIVYRIFYHPYLVMFQEFEIHLAELHGTQLQCTNCDVAVFLLITLCSEKNTQLCCRL